MRFFDVKKRARALSNVRARLGEGLVDRRSAAAIGTERVVSVGGGRRIRLRPFVCGYARKVVPWRCARRCVRMRRIRRRCRRPGTDGTESSRTRLRNTSRRWRCRRVAHFALFVTDGAAVGVEQCRHAQHRVIRGLGNRGQRIGRAINPGLRRARRIRSTGSPSSPARRPEPR